MKIVYFIEGTFNSGGIERIVIEKANWLSLKGHDVTIITSEQNGRSDFFPLKGVKRIDMDLMFTNIPENNFINKFFRRKKLLAKEKELIIKYINKLSPDIVISTFRYEKNILPKIKDKSKKIVEIHFSRWFRLQRNRKGIGGLIDRFLTWQDIRNLSQYDKFICLTEEDKQHWKGIKNIDVINNFIELKTKTPAPLLNNKCIAVGRLVYQKGFDRLIEIWKEVHKKYPEWKLTIYGDGPLKGKLNKMISECRLKDVIKICEPTKEIYEKYLESSILLMTSHYEGLPMVMLEAMEAGLPIVSFDFKCGPKDVIQEGENGFIIKDGDIIKMAEAIGKLIESQDLRSTLGKNSFKMAKKYSKEAIMAQWENLFMNL